MGRKRRRGSCTAKCLLGIVAILALAVLSGGPARSVHAEELVLDRLFFSPEDRVVLETLRESSSRSASPAVESKGKKEEVVEEKPQTFTLGGTVTGKSGVRAVWLNGRSYPSTALPVNVEVRKPYAAGQVVLQVPDNSKSYALRPGQTLYLGDGRIRESYERPPAPAAAGAVGTDAAAKGGAAVGPGGGTPEKP